MLAPPRQRPIPEVARLMRGLARLPILARELRSLPQGDGTAVLVLPGFMAGDGSTLILRAFLGQLGYRAFGWGMGRNRGDVDHLVPRVAKRIAELAAREGGRVHLVGWSLGGVLAREASRIEPSAVAQIVTLGTPIVGGPKYTLAARHYRQRGVDLDAIEETVAATNAIPLPVPITAVFSRDDGVVAWRACLDENPGNDVRHIEVRSGHAELGFSPEVYRVVAQALADAACRI